MTSATDSVLAVLYEEPGPRTRRLMTIATFISLCVLVVLCALVVRQFYRTGQLDGRYWFFFTRATTWLFLAKGLLGTVGAALFAGVVAFVLGFCMMLGRLSRHGIVRVLSIALIEFTRGVPTLLFIYFFFLGLPALGIKIRPLLKIALPVAISAAGVVAEVLRSGVHAVPRGQREAALSVGLREWQVFMKIVFPQAFRFVIPSLISDLVIVVKDTTFAYIVNFPDLMQNAKVLISNYDAMLSVYLLTALFYVGINYVLNSLSIRIAHRSFVDRDFSF